MRDKVLKSDKYKQAMRDGTLDSKTLTIVPRKDYTLEEESRDIYQEIVEGFDVLENNRLLHMKFKLDDGQETDVWIGEKLYNQLITHPEVIRRYNLWRIGKAILE